MKERNYGIDLLRIVSMMLVLLIHVLPCSGFLEAEKNGIVTFQTAWIINIITYCAVDCFAMISGYVGYGTKIKYRNIVVLWLQVVTLSLMINLVFSALSMGQIGIREWIGAFLPVTGNTNWYFTGYFCMFFFIPFFNRLLDALSEKEANVLIITSFLVFSVFQTLVHKDLFGTEGGLSMVWLSLLYLIGAWMKKYDILGNWKKRRYLLVFLVCVFVTWISKVLIEAVTIQVLGEAKAWAYLITYTSPTMVLQAVMLVLLFAGIKLPAWSKKIIHIFAGTSFGVLMIHTNSHVWNLLSNEIAGLQLENKSVLFMLLFLLGVTIGIYLVCSAADLIRKGIFSVLHIETHLERAETRIREKCSSLNSL